MLLVNNLVYIIKYGKSFHPLHLIGYKTDIRLFFNTFRVHVTSNVSNHFTQAKPNKQLWSLIIFFLFFLFHVVYFGWGDKLTMLPMCWPSLLLSKIVSFAVIRLLSLPLFLKLGWESLYFFLLLNDISMFNKKEKKSQT